MDRSDKLKAELQNYGMDVIERRIKRLKKRRIVIFPYLRAKWLLRKLRKLMA